MAMATKVVIPFYLSTSTSSKNPFLRYPQYKPSFSDFQIRCARRSVRTGKKRYPSEKKKLERIQKPLDDVKNKEEGFWRLSKLNVPVHKDPGKDDLSVSLGLLEAIAKVLEFPVASMLPPEAFTVVRKSIDARKLLKEPKFVYTVHMDVKKLLDLLPRTWDFISRLEPKLGLVEHFPEEKVSGDLINIVYDCKQIKEVSQTSKSRPKVAIVGSGPSGLFASLVLAELGADVTLIERGEAVEQRGRDIGALVVRRLLQEESNFCFGEGGAGTWSDGKLVTRIGRNSDSVLAVMKTLVHFGAPPNILVDGKPHLGTDRLIPLLRNFRQHLQGLGVTIKFGTRVDDLLVENSQVIGVKVSDSRQKLHADSLKLGFDAVVLAVGHSARDTYEMLLSYNVDLAPKDFAVGLRIEHPQELINSIQYSALANEVRNGRGKVPVADYKVVKYVDEDDSGSSSKEWSRSCYSFCMCPGGQVVLTSTNPSELCINGMSFSRRASKWANAALVVTVSSKDFDSHGPLAGVEFQRVLERRAATMGGGNFVLPVQTVTDFLENKLTVTSVPPSSYRLGVKVAALHELFPAQLTKALQRSITMFDRELPGFISSEALLHGVETRTSSPVQISRDSNTYESTSMKGLYPIGEGAGYAGGIVSAAVDGLFAGFAVAKKLDLFQGSIESVFGKAQKNTGFVKY
ncbi:FAD/NAD(P)-binding oxidoreductase family protein [Thalictrum thalictroides]|uniref:FAD/NAD(P)-binding oxidoreductase family protein n=1 Tax=Thalictrum thalictroides TaxID=46969 RepID=A0A7J6VB74_THATH|nr:FAD/NAD(P)-binding oxidoreductase family protein [Thalictrum thalictroides]